MIRGKVEEAGAAARVGGARSGCRAGARAPPRSQAPAVARSLAPSPAAWRRPGAAAAALRAETHAGEGRGRRRPRKLTWGARDPSPAEAGRERVAHPGRCATTKSSGAEAVSLPPPWKIPASTCGSWQTGRGQQGRGRFPRPATLLGDETYFVTRFLGGGGSGNEPLRRAVELFSGVEGDWGRRKKLWGCESRDLRS